MAAKIAKFERMKIDESYVSAYNTLASELAFRQIDPQVFLSSHPRPEDFPRIHKTFGIDSFVNLHMKDNALRDYARKNKLTVLDAQQDGLTDPEFPKTKKLIGDINQICQQGHRVLIFCGEGFGRSTLIGKALLITRGVDANTAARLVSPFNIEERGIIDTQVGIKPKRQKN